MFENPNNLESQSLMNNDKMYLDIAGTQCRLDLVRSSGTILYEYIGGSHAYGTAVETSDKDVRGVFCMPMSYYLSLGNPIDSVQNNSKTEGETKNDVMFFTLRRFFELLKGANPNILEALWLPPDVVVSSSPEIELIIKHRDLFISKACLGSHFGYARQQIQKARGKNKKVNNPCPKRQPQKKDFCRIIHFMPSDKGLTTHPDVKTSLLPFRPIPLNETPWVDLNHYHVASLEHTHNGYRMYYYGEESKGVFRGNDMLVCESIPQEDEWPRFSGILLYDENEYEKATKEWKSYWDWVDNRNIHRWVDQENRHLTFDQKNMLHCFRLLFSGLNILKNGEPIVRFSGDQLKFLMDIRKGNIRDYDFLMDKVESLVAEMEAESVHSSLPEHIDAEKVNGLYMEVAESAWNRLFGEKLR